MGATCGDAQAPDRHACSICRTLRPLRRPCCLAAGSTQAIWAAWTTRATSSLPASAERGLSFRHSASQACCTAASICLPQ